MTEKQRKPTLMQLRVSLPKKIVITAAVMVALILFVYYFNIPNPNMILIAGLVLCSALFGFGGGIVAAMIMLGYTLFFFSTDHRFTQFTPENMKDRVELRFGLYSNAQQELDIEERFVRAKIAADRVKDDSQKICGFYDLE